MALLTKSEFGKLAGVSRQRIYQMVKERNLIEDKNGKLNTENRTNKNYLIQRDRPDGLKTSDEIKRVKGKKIKKKEKAEPITEGKKQVNKKNEIVKAEKKSIKIIDDNDDDPDEVGNDKYELQCIKLKADIKKIDIINAEKRNDLIPRELVKKFIDQIYQIDSQEFLQLSSHLTAKICQGIFKTDNEKKLLEVAKLIDRESYKTLEHIQKKINTFLSGLEKTIEDNS